MSILEYTFDDSVTLGQFWKCRCDGTEGLPFLHPNTHRKCIFCLTHGEDGVRPFDREMNSHDVAFLPGDTVALADGTIAVIYNVDREARKARVWLKVDWTGTVEETEINTTSVAAIFIHGSITPTHTVLGQHLYRKLEE